LQDFCIQSSQIGPHLVQPLTARPKAATLKIITKRLNIIHLVPTPLSYGPKSGIFKPRRVGSISPEYVLEWVKIAISGEETPRMQHEPQAEEQPFDIEEARRVLAEVFAPWVADLSLSIDSLDHAPPANATADWQPGAVLRMPFSERLCRHGGIVCGQALMAFADTSMVIANLAANRGYRPMTTVDQTTHFMRAVTQCDVLADARVVRLGRTMSFGRVTLFSATDNKPVAMVSSAFAML
jgi:uncharacterized protein (TIGR00369 family)